MTITNVSTSYLGTAMLPAVSQADAQLTQLETESSTGEYADLGEQLGNSSGYELSLRGADDWLQSLTSANSIVAGRLSTTSDALGSIVSSAQTALSGLVAWEPGTTAGSNLATTGDDSLQSLTEFANASYDDQFVFGGINAGAAPMALYSASSASQAALVGAFETQFGFLPTDNQAQNLTALEVTSFLNGAFTGQFSGSSWAANWSSASSTDESTQISPSQTIETSTNLNAGGFQPIAEAYAMLSMFGDDELSQSAKQAVISTATTLINQGIGQLTTMGASVGQMRDQVKQADDDMATQLTLIKTQIGSLDDVDASQIATQLNTLTTQLETAYQVTAQLQKLSLAQYLAS